jgi:hypothetical protein
MRKLAISILVILTIITTAALFFNGLLERIIFNADWVQGLQSIGLSLLLLYVAMGFWGED